MFITYSNCDECGFVYEVEYGASGTARFANGHEPDHTEDGDAVFNIVHGRRECDATFIARPIL